MNQRNHRKIGKYFESCDKEHITHQNWWEEAKTAFRRKDKALNTYFNSQMLYIYKELDQAK